MKIEINEIKTASKILKDMIFYVSLDKSEIFFPISTAEEKEFDGLTLTTKSTASRSSLIPGLVAKETFDANGRRQTTIELAYADSRFCPEFSPLQFLEMIGEVPSKKLREFLKDKECYLIEKEYIKASYTL